MSHNPERYTKPEEFDLTTKIAELRIHVGELKNLQQPTDSEVTEAIDSLFPNLLTHEKAKLAETFQKSETDAADTADNQLVD